jgi:hypothetical protein
MGTDYRADLGRCNPQPERLDRGEFATLAGVVDL